MTHQLGASEPVKFELDGEEYRLRFTLGALKALDHDHGIKIMKGGDAMMDAVRDPGKLALILFHGLRTCHPEITIEWVEANFDSSMLLDLAPVVGQAIGGKAAQLPNVDPPGKVNGIGSLSGQSVDMTLGSLTPSSGV